MADAQNNIKTATKTVGKPFEKGKSGNPGGRPKIPQDFKEACREFTPRAVEILTEIANSNKSRDNDRIKAIEVLMDRGYGKPTQALEVDTKTIPQVVLVGAVDLKD